MRYPVGEFSFEIAVTQADRLRYIGEIAALPAQLRAAVDGRLPADLERTYRDGGWTTHQVIHHVADSHMNGYTRFKLALTAQTPVITPYNETRWAELADARAVHVSTSISIIEGLHARWAALAETLTEADYARGYFHPEHGRVIPLDVCLAQYAWHSRHHLAHVMIALRLS